MVPPKTPSTHQTRLDDLRKIASEPALGRPPSSPGLGSTTPAHDPFAAPITGGGGSPFGGSDPGTLPPQPAPPPAPAAAAIRPGADPFAPAAAAGGSPFGGGPAHDPFAAPSGDDPFGGAGPADPFGTPTTAGPFSALAGGTFEGPSAQAELADELFSGAPPAAAPGPPPPPEDSGLRAAPPHDPGPAAPIEDPFASSPSSSVDPFQSGAWSADAGPPPALVPSDEAQPTAIHSVSRDLVEKARPEPRPKKRRPPVLARPGVVRAVQALGRWVMGVVNTALLVGFLGVAILWARGASVDDVKQGRVVQVLLGQGASAGADDLRAIDVAVTRRPLAADPGLVVITGLVENTGDLPAGAVRVEVRFGEQTFTGWAGLEVDALDLALAPDKKALHDIGAREARADLLPGETRPFVVLATDVDDGARAHIEVRRADPAARAAGPEG